MDANEKLNRAISDEWEFVGDKNTLCRILRAEVIRLRDVVQQMVANEPCFDHKCPYCDKEIDVQRHWSDRDHQAEFQLQCDWCSRNVQISVGMEPIFETSKPQCLMCAKAEANYTGHYCNACHAKLIVMEANDAKVAGK